MSRTFLPTNAAGVFALLAVSSASVHAQQASLSTPFSEDFSDPMKSSNRWDQTTNGGSLTFADRSVLLKGVGGGYPVIKLKSNPFPSTGGFTVSFGYRYISVGNYGVSITCGSSSGSAFVCIHQDMHGQLIQADSKNLFGMSPNTDWHVVSFVKAGSLLTAFLDGKQVGSAPAGVLPSFIQIGGGSMSNPWDWNDLELKLIRVDVGKIVLGKTALHADENPSATPTTPSDTHSLNTPKALPLIAVKPIEVENAAVAYQMSQNTIPVIGILSQVTGIWQVSAIIYNHTAKEVYLVPYCLLFSDGSRESLYNSDGWRAIHDERTIVVSSVLGDSVTPTVDIHATYLTPTLDPLPTISMSPSSPQKIEVYAENGGGWIYKTTTRSDGNMESSLSADEQVNRVPVCAMFLQVSAPIAPIGTSLSREDRLLSSFTPAMLLPYQQFMSAVKAIPIPAKDDPRWIAVSGNSADGKPRAPVYAKSGF